MASGPAPSSPAPEPSAIETDALVVGAGPVGLFQVFELGLLEISAHVVDVLPMVGGQCAELYPDKPIYDIPGLSATSGLELAERLRQQAAPFAPTYHLGQEVTSLQRGHDGRLQVGTSQGLQFLARAVVIAAGVGAFKARRLAVDGLARFEGAQVDYRMGELAHYAGHHVVIIGGDTPAIEQALRLSSVDAARPASVTLIHRRARLDADAALLETFQARCAEGALRFVVGQVTGCEVTADRLTHVIVTDPEGHTQPLPVDALCVLLGLSPKLGPIADWGLALSRKQLVVNTATFETDQPGIFAVGDVVTYPGKRKLIVCGFHEATLAAYGVSERLRPGEPTLLQYTTTSPRLHRLLGVSGKTGSVSA
jgi:thioredoxin reductase (NADPH)